MQIPRESIFAQGVHAHLFISGLHGVPARAGWELLQAATALGVRLFARLTQPLSTMGCDMLYEYGILRWWRSQRRL
jgi:hypothetical protein